MRSVSRWSLSLLQISSIALFATAMVRAEPISVDEIVVKDGDTIHARGAEFRMIGYDTPETWTRRRKVGPDERALAMIAKERFGELLKSGSLDLTEVRCSCSAKQRRENTCNHQRKCGVLTLNGTNIGDILIAEELAVPFRCTKSKCQKMPDWPTIIKRMENH
jgi:endonuclease YncB( thermonuclease family)